MGILSCSSASAGSGSRCPILCRHEVRYVARMLHLVVLVLAVLMSCNDGSKGVSVGSLVGDDWRLVRWTADGKPVTLAEGPQITLAVHPDGGVSGNGSVNRYHGAMTLSDGKVAWGGPGFASTRMAGPPPLMDQELRYLAALAKVDHAALDGRTLTLTGGGQSNVLQFER